LSQRCGWKAGLAPPDPDEAELEEREGMAIGGVPEPYLDAWARLQCQKPPRVSDAEWRQAIDDAGRFLDQRGSLAVEFRWSAGDLFDVPRDNGTCGLVWFLKGERVRGLGPEHAVLWGGERVLDKLTRGEWINPYMTLSSADSSSTEPKKSFQTSTTLRRAGRPCGRTARLTDFE
jgi:hypothetical protein